MLPSHRVGLQSRKQFFLFFSLPAGSSSLTAMYRILSYFLDLTSCSFRRSGCRPRAERRRLACNMRHVLANVFLFWSRTASWFLFSFLYLPYLRMIPSKSTSLIAIQQRIDGQGRSLEFGRVQPSDVAPPFQFKQTS